MELIFKKISSYNLFNYIFTGFVFVFLLEIFIEQKFYIESASKFIEFGNLFWIYFVGLTISRFGSIFIEPIFRKVVGFAPYEEYIKAEKLDSKIAALSEQNNIYRTVLSLLFLFSIYYLSLGYSNPEYLGEITTILVVCLVVLYIFSYAKQITYIKKRVDYNINNDKEN